MKIAEFKERLKYYGEESKRFGYRSDLEPQKRRDYTTAWTCKLAEDFVYLRKSPSLLKILVDIPGYGFKETFEDDRFNQLVQSYLNEKELDKSRAFYFWSGWGVDSKRFDYFVNAANSFRDFFNDGLVDKLQAAPGSESKSGLKPYSWESLYKAIGLSNYEEHGEAFKKAVKLKYWNKGISKVAKSHDIQLKPSLITKISKLPIVKRILSQPNRL